MFYDYLIESRIISDFLLKHNYYLPSSCTFYELKGFSKIIISTDIDIFVLGLISIPIYKSSFVHITEKTIFSSHSLLKDVLSLLLSVSISLYS